MHAKKPAKKAPAKKAPAKKTPAKTAPPKKDEAPARKKAAAKKTPAKSAAPARAASAAKGAGGGDLEKQIQARFREIGGWRADTLAHVRSLILEADPALVEERKWIKPSNPFGVLAYSRAGLVLTLEVYKSVVKVTFAQGSKVPDPTGIFNASLLGLRRAVDIAEGEHVDAAAFQSLVKAAVAVNVAKRG